MKFLIHSNAPNAQTGYGVQCAQLAQRLQASGHEVAVSATWGQQASVGSWKGIRVYPAGWHLNGLDIIHNHALHWFDGDPLGGWIIVLGDVWSLADHSGLKDFNVAAWTPVDHFPVPVGVLQFFEQTNALPIAMSKFGERNLRDADLDPQYVPLSVDTAVYKPTPTIASGDDVLTGRQLLGVDEETFLVGMVAMNKDPDDRKGFNEAFAGFAEFHQAHPDSLLYVHTDRNGMGTSFNLEHLARLSRIPAGAIRFVDTYAGIQMGWTPEMMAAAYTAFDVLLAPSHGEGFCVPLIEAQACGTPVIASDFSAQPELVGAGWKLEGQQLYEPAQKSFYIMPFVHGIVGALEQAYLADMDDLAVAAIAKASEYDADRVFEEHWRPLLRQMTADPVLPDLDRDEPFEVEVIVPAMRADNLDRLVESFDATNDGSAVLTIVGDNALRGWVQPGEHYPTHLHTDKDHTSYAEKINLAMATVPAGPPWVFLCGDDVEFHEGWLEEAAKYAERFDVIGTNDSLPGRVRNPLVAAGQHADHFFVRRSYVDRYGASLDGPGSLAPTAYGHWFVDKEIIELAKARGTFTPCLSSVVEHHHPGYDGKPRDDVYMKAIELSTDDASTYEARRPLIEMQRQTVGRR